MIIAIAADINDLNQTISSSFGRCHGFYLFNRGTGEIVFTENPGILCENTAGIEAANFLLKQNIEIIIAGRFGTKVITIFREKNIQIVIPQSSKTVNQIIDKLKNELIK